MTRKMIRRLQDLDSFTDKDVQAALDRDDPEELALVSITVALASEDSNLACSTCVRLAASTVPRVRGNALIGLGHIARRFRALADTQVHSLIEQGIADIDEYVRASAKSAADEIHQFLGWTFKSHTYGI